MKQAATCAITLAFALAAALPGHASDAHRGHGAAQAVRAPAAFSDGEVKKIDKNAGKITIKHGPLVNLEMPAMTMVFRVADSRMLERVKAGDKIRFEADNVNGALTVVALQSE